jgi:hypothetical protein
MQIFNLYGDGWDETRGREGWRIKEAFVGHHIGGELIGASMSEVEPGNKLWPYLGRRGLGQRRQIVLRDLRRCHLGLRLVDRAVWLERPTKRT